VIEDQLKRVSAAAALSAMREMPELLAISTSRGPAHTPTRRAVRHHFAARGVTRLVSEPSGFLTAHDRDTRARLQLALIAHP
jgi:hypothetical protein